MNAILREPFDETVYVTVQHYHDEETDEPIFFLACEKSPDEFARVDSPQTVAVYKLVGTVTVKANIEVSELEAQ